MDGALDSDLAAGGTPTDHQTPTWRIIWGEVGNHQVLGVTATKRPPPQNWVIGATANPEIPKSATHNELQSEGKKKRGGRRDLASTVQKDGQGNPKSATHNELQPRLVALREKLPTLHTLLVYSDVF